MKYVVYLTYYSGEKLPKWYIGSSNEEKIKKEYNGTILSKKWKEIYLSEQKENKYLFKTRILSYHKLRKDALAEELRLQKKHFVVKNSEYFNESYAQVNGYFGRDISGKLHPRFGDKHTEESKRKMSKTRLKKIKDGEILLIGENNPMFGKKSIFKDGIYKNCDIDMLNYWLEQEWIIKGKPKSEEHKKKLCITHTGKKLSVEHKRKISEGGKGRIGSMLGKKLSKKRKDEIGEKSKDRIWYFNEELKKTKFVKINEAKLLSSDWKKGRKFFK